MQAVKSTLYVFGTLAAGLAVFSAPTFGAETEDAGATAIVSDTAGPVAEVFRSDEARQCEPDSGVSIGDMQQRLANAGITVKAAACGERSGVQVLAVCGGPTNNIYVFTIGAADLEEARDLGFAETAELPFGHDGTRWRPVDCP